MKPHIIQVLVTSPIGDIAVEGQHDFVSRIYFTNPENEFTETIEPTGALRICVEELKAYFEGTNFIFSFPFRQEGTEFQHEVWTELCTTKAGETLTYLGLSNNIGKPLAIRAVANANGKNKLAIVVPCHRIIGTNGSLTGYNAGLWRKKWLLQHEAKFVQQPGTLF